MCGCACWKWWGCIVKLGWALIYSDHSVLFETFRGSRQKPIVTASSTKRILQIYILPISPGLPSFFMSLLTFAEIYCRNGIRKVQVQQAEMECHKMKGIAHGRSHARAMAEDQHRSAQQVETTSHGIYGVWAPLKNPKQKMRNPCSLYCSIIFPHPQHPLIFLHVEWRHRVLISSRIAEVENMSF